MFSIIHALLKKILFTHILGHFLKLTLLIILGLGIKLIDDLSLFITMSHRVSMWGISKASQIDWTVLDVVPDSGPKIAATPDLSRWQTRMKKVDLVFPILLLPTSLVSVKRISWRYFLNLSGEERVVEQDLVIVYSLHCVSESCLLLPMSDKLVSHIKQAAWTFYSNSNFKEIPNQISPLLPILMMLGSPAAILNRRITINNLAWIIQPILIGYNLASVWNRWLLITRFVCIVHIFTPFTWSFLSVEIIGNPCRQHF